MFGIFKAEKDVHILMNRSHTSLVGLDSTLTIFDEIIVKRTVHIGRDVTIVLGEDRHDQTFVDVMTGGDVVRDRVKRTHQKLGSYNETGKEVVQSNENTAEDNGSRGGFDQTHKELAHVRVDRKIEREKSL